MEASERTRELMHAAGACVNSGDRTGVLAALGEARPLLAAARTGADDPQPTVYKFQATQMAWIAGDPALALDYATLLVSDVSDKLEGLFHEYDKTMNFGRLIFANVYARAFIPFLPKHAWIDRSWQEPQGPSSDSNFFDLLKAIATRMRPQLDALGWAAWAFPADAAREARYWSARVACDLGRALIDNAATGRHAEDAQRMAEVCLELLNGLQDGPARLVASDAYSLLGRALMAYGDARLVRDRVIESFQESLRIQEQFGVPADAAVDRSNLAAFYFELGRFAAAEAEGGEEEAKRAEGDRKQAVAEKAGAEAKEKRGAAEVYFGRAEAIFTEALRAFPDGDAAGNRLIPLVNLGALTAERKDLAGAAKWFAEACAEARLHGQERTKLFVLALSQLGKVRGEQGDLAAAEGHLKEVVDLLGGPDAPRIGPEESIKVRADYGNTLRRMGRVEEAYPHLTDAVDQVEAYRQTFLALRPGIGLLKSYRWVFEALIDCCATLGEQAPDRWARAFNLAETVKWQIFTSVLRFAPLRLRGRENHPRQDEEAALMRLVGDALIGRADQTAGNTQVESAMRRLEEIWTELEPIDPEYVAIRRQKTIEAGQVAGLLDNQVPVLVEYYLGEEIDGLALAFVFHKDAPGVRVVRLPHKSSEIRTGVENLRRQTDEASAQRFEEAARRLYDALIAPILPWLPEEAGICFVPVGSLHNIPFSALYDGRRYLIERNPVVIAPTATALRWWVRKNSRAPRRCLIFTATRNVTIDHRKASDLADFTHLAQGEIKPLFAEATLVPPPDATKARLLHELADGAEGAPWDVVHVACHGIFDYGARLIMAGNPDDHDKDLTAREIFVSVRPSATLVTLSACESGIAATSTNDEIFGLGHGFLFGGASSVLASLWYVVQGVGVELTRKFYMNWMGQVEGGGPTTKVEALRRAQRQTMRRKTWFGLFEKKTHPYQWSAFQLLGDWR